MLHKSHDIVQSQKSNVPLWTRDEAIIKKKRSFFVDERRNLHLDDKYNIDRIRKEYGSKIEAYEYHDAECPI